MVGGEIVSICALAVYLTLLVAVLYGWYAYLHEAKKKFVKHCREQVDEELLDPGWTAIGAETKLVTIGIENEDPIRLEQLQFNKKIPKIE